MRRLFGNDYNPFESNIKHGLHPLPDFLKTNWTSISCLLFIDSKKYIFD